MLLLEYFLVSFHLLKLFLLVLVLRVYFYVFDLKIQFILDRLNSLLLHNQLVFFGHSIFHFLFHFFSLFHLSLEFSLFSYLCFLFNLVLNCYQISLLVFLLRPCSLLRLSNFLKLLMLFLQVLSFFDFLIQFLIDYGLFLGEPIWSNVEWFPSTKHLELLKENLLVSCIIWLFTKT